MFPYTSPHGHYYLLVTFSPDRRRKYSGSAPTFESVAGRFDPENLKGGGIRDSQRYSPNYRLPETPLTYCEGLVWIQQLR